jgi:hypothetical protein
MPVYQSESPVDEVAVYLEAEWLDLEDNWTVSVQEIPENTTTPEIL